MEIIIDDLLKPEVINLVMEHKQSMLKITPEESVHALDLNELKDDLITFWTIWDKGELMGCGALKELGNNEGEVKSMRTHASYLRQGIAKKMLEHIIEQAKIIGYTNLYLETGTSGEFIPAHMLYRKLGFEKCSAFSKYEEDGSSCFMMLTL